MGNAFSNTHRRDLRFLADLGARSPLRAIHILSRVFGRKRLAFEIQKRIPPHHLTAC
jgi:hypothetical protein